MTTDSSSCWFVSSINCDWIRVDRSSCIKCRYCLYFNAKCTQVHYFIISAREFLSSREWLNRLIAQVVCWSWSSWPVHSRGLIYILCFFLVRTTHWVRHLGHTPFYLLCESWIWWIINPVQYFCSNCLFVCFLYCYSMGTVSFTPVSWWERKSVLNSFILLKTVLVYVVQCI